MAFIDGDKWLDWLKRRQRWYYGTEYRDQELSQEWLQRSADARYEQTLFRVTVPRPLKSILVFKPDEIGDAVGDLLGLAEYGAECFFGIDVLVWIHRS